MYFFGKILMIVTVLMMLLNGLLFLGTIVELLEQWIGVFAYFVSIFVAPIFAPAFIVFPWFEAWVTGEEVSDVILYIWLGLIACLALRVATWKWAPDN